MVRCPILDLLQRSRQKSSSSSTNTTRFPCPPAQAAAPLAPAASFLPEPTGSAIPKPWPDGGGHHEEEEDGPGAPGRQGAEDRAQGGHNPAAEPRGRGRFEQLHSAKHPMGRKSPRDPTRGGAANADHRDPRRKDPPWPGKAAGDAASACSWVSLSSFMMGRSSTTAQSVRRVSARDPT